jgi:hypothetical protein
MPGDPGRQLRRLSGSSSLVRLHSKALFAFLVVDRSVVCLIVFDSSIVRTGRSVLSDLWPYVLEMFSKIIYVLKNLGFFVPGCKQAGTRGICRGRTAEMFGNRVYIITRHLSQFRTQLPANLNLSLVMDDPIHDFTCNVSRALARVTRTLSDPIPDDPISPKLVDLSVRLYSIAERLEHSQPGGKRVTRKRITQYLTDLERLCTVGSPKSYLSSASPSPRTQEADVPFSGRRTTHGRRLAEPRLRQSTSSGSRLLPAASLPQPRCRSL